MKYFSWIAIAFVAAAVIGSFFLIDSPAHRRLVRLDERRVSDLQSIQYSTLSYFRTKGKLPTALDEMKGFENFSIPLDPSGGAMYEYSVKSQTQFQLCANFALSSDENPDMKQSAPYPQEFMGNNWIHPAGRGCFDITVEKNDPGLQYEYPSATVKPVI